MSFRWAAVILIAAALHAADVAVGGATIHVTFDSGETDLPQAAFLRWIRRAAESVTAYFGKFPLAETRVHVIQVPDRRGTLGATTWGHSGGYTRISVGRHTSQNQLDDDWMMTHELTHLAFPDLPKQHQWLEEGLATYVEPIARVQAGQLPAARIWADMVRDMPQGQPESSDLGLDYTHTWGRTYWGGAMFCLVADVRIRECSKNRKGLQDALRAVLGQRGTMEHAWPIEDFWKVGDAATGCTVLRDLYEEWKGKPVTVDLAAMWHQLGVFAALDDKAPLARVRKAITTPR